MIGQTSKKLLLIFVFGGIAFGCKKDVLTDNNDMSGRVYEGQDYFTFQIEFIDGEFVKRREIKDETIMNEVAGRYKYVEHPSIMEVVYSQPMGSFSETFVVENDGLKRRRIGTYDTTYLYLQRIR